MDRCGRIHDGRPKGDRQCLCHRRTFIHGGDGAVQLRGKGDISTDNLPRVSQEYTDSCEEHVQSVGTRHPHKRKSREGWKGNQGNLFNQRHLPGDHHEPLYGGGHRREFPYFQCADGERRERVPCVAGGQREQYHHSRQKLRRGFGRAHTQRGVLRRAGVGHV